MELDNQGQPLQPSQPAMPVQGVPEPADLSTVQQFQVTPEQPAQIEGQVQEQPGNGVVPQVPQSMYSQEVARRLAVEQQNAALQQQWMDFMQRSQQPAQANPFDLTTQYPQWFGYEMDKRDQKLNEQVGRQMQENLGNLLSRAQESSWAQRHPGVDPNAIKAWGQTNGVSNLDHAWTLMNLPQTLQNTAQSAITQAGKHQPIFAQPLRNTQSAAQPTTGYSYEAAVKEYIKDPSVMDRWPKDFQAAFRTETLMRNKKE